MKFARFVLHRCCESKVYEDKSRAFQIYKNSVQHLAGGGLKWTIDLWVLPPDKRGRGVGTLQVMYLLQRPDIRVLEVGNPVNTRFWSRFRPSSLQQIEGQAETRQPMVLKNDLHL